VVKAPISRKNNPTTIPTYFITYGSVSNPAPKAVDIKANILPLIDPGVNEPNHL